MNSRWLLALLAAIVLFVGARVLLNITAGPDDQLHRAEAAFAAHELESAEALAIAALQVTPVDGRGYRVLARVALERGDAQRADFLNALALRYAPRDLQAQSLAALSAMDRRDFAAAVRHLERILRVEPPMAETVFPLMAQAVVTPEGRNELALRIADRPSWRLYLLSYLAHSLPRAADLPPLFHAVGARASLAPDELSNYIGRFVEESRWNDAFVAWVDELPQERRQQFDSPVDGAFELPVRTGAPFDWQFTPAGGVEAGIVSRPGGSGHALQVTFAGSRTPFDGARQLLLLQPARHYRMQWQSRFETLATGQGLHWVIHCASEQGGTLLATEPRQGSQGWRDDAAEFDVPADCPAQWLQLELAQRIKSDAQAVGAAWFDNVAILLVERSTQ